MRNFSHKKWKLLGELAVICQMTELIVGQTKNQIYGYCSEQVSNLELWTTERKEKNRRVSQRHPQGAGYQHRLLRCTGPLVQPWNFEAPYSQHEMTVASHTKCRVLFCRVPRCRVPFCRAPRCRVSFFREVRGVKCYTCRNSAQHFRNPSTTDHRHPLPILQHWKRQVLTYAIFYPVCWCKQITETWLAP